LAKEEYKWTKIDIFQRETEIYASLDLKGSRLPLKVKLRVAENHHDALPDDLAIYMS
jgi:hypothetical protein